MRYEQRPRSALVSLSVGFFAILFLVPLVLVWVILWGAVKALVLFWELGLLQTMFGKGDDGIEIVSDSSVEWVDNSPVLVVSNSEPIESRKVLRKGKAIEETFESLADMRKRNDELRDRVASMR